VCPYEHQCMSEISVEMALRACEELLEATHTAERATNSPSS